MTTTETPAREALSRLRAHTKKIHRLEGEREALILEAVGMGCSTRVVGEAAGVHHATVARLAQRERRSH